MPHGSDDARKRFILTTTGNFYGLKPPSSLDDSPELNNFLDDGNEFVLSISRHESGLHFSNKVIQITVLLHHVKHPECFNWSIEIYIYNTLKE